MNLKYFWRYVTIISLLFCTSLAYADAPLIPGLFSWPMQGGSELNQNHSFAPLINKATINYLKQTDLSPVVQAAGLNLGRLGVTPSVAPAFIGGKFIQMMYASDSNGNLYGFDVTNNKLVWKKNFVSDYSPHLNGKTIYYNYITPTIAGDLILVGSNYGEALAGLSVYPIAQSGAILLAINRYTGAFVWYSQLDPMPFSIITASPVVHNGIAYVGISSDESGIPGAMSPSLPALNYNCCQFRGNVVAVNLSNGSIKWRKFLIPSSQQEQDNYAVRPSGANSFSGAAVWGGQLAFDAKRNQVIVTTGQLHNLPASIDLHHLPAGTATDAIVALDASSGNVKWMHNFGIIPNPADQLNPLLPDVWNISCIASIFPLLLGTPPNPYANDIVTYCRSDLSYPSNPDLINPANQADMLTGSMFNIFNVFFSDPNCFANPVCIQNVVAAANAWQNDPNGTNGRDRDFAQGAMVLYDVKMPNGSKKDLIVSMQKATVMHAIDANTGATVWDSPALAAPGSSASSRASAYDGQYIYGIGYNSGGLPITVSDRNGHVLLQTQGSDIAAIDPATGDIVWVKPFPTTTGTGPSGLVTLYRTSRAAMSVVNGMIIVGDDWEDLNPLVSFQGIVVHDAGSYLYVFNAKDGSLIKTFTASKPAGTIVAPAVVGSNIYWITSAFHPESVNTAPIETGGQIIKLSLF